MESLKTEIKTISLQSKYSRAKTITAIMKVDQGSTCFELEFISTAKTIGACKTLITKYINDKIHSNGIKKLKVIAKYDDVISIRKVDAVDAWSGAGISKKGWVTQ